MIIARNTAQQKLVLEILSESSKALSADEILSKLPKTINKSTVYRILEKFVQQGKIHFVTGEEGKSFYALCKSCSAESHNHFHIHFQCRKCKVVKCLPQTVDVPNLENYTILDSQFPLIGICEACNKN